MGLFVTIRYSPTQRTVCRNKVSCMRCILGTCGKFQHWRIVDYMWFSMWNICMSADKNRIYVCDLKLPFLIEIGHRAILEMWHTRHLTLIISARRYERCHFFSLNQLPWASFTRKKYWLIFLDLRYIFEFHFC